jgi:hypothetical protein
MSAVSLSQRSSVRPVDRGGVEDSLTSPPANRSGGTRWRDPRLWLGTLLVLASVVVGARVLAAADDTVAVWTLDHDASAGTSITAADVRAMRLHFTSTADQSRYWLADDPLPAQAHLTRDVGNGELLAKAALSTDSSTVVHQLPLGVEAAGLPVDLAPGDHVDVWAVPKPEDARGHPELVLGDAAVLALTDGTLAGLGSDRQVVVGLVDSTDTQLVLDRLNGTTVVLVRISG